MTARLLETAPGRMLVVIPSIVCAFYIGFGLLLYILQPSLLFFPTRALNATPADIGLYYQDLTLYSGPERVPIHAWFISAEADRGTLLFCHGNAGNISDRLDSIEIFHNLGLNVLIFDYRGYGLSEGRMSEQGFQRDALAAWNHLVEDRGIPPERIVLFGRSLGGSVAAWLAGEVRPGALIIESAFSRLVDIARHYYPIFPVRWLVRYRFDTLHGLARARCPVLIAHSPDDEIIPFSHAETLHAAAPEPRQFLQMIGGHNDGFWLTGERYIRGLEDFLAEHFDPAADSHP